MGTSKLVVIKLDVHDENYSHLHEIWNILLPLFYIVIINHKDHMICQVH